MADGCKSLGDLCCIAISSPGAVNQARAMRVAEIMQDFRTVQNYLAGVRPQIPRHDANQEGYLLIRQCLHEAQQLIAQPYAASGSHPRGDAEKEKAQLRQYVELKFPCHASTEHFITESLWTRVFDDSGHRSYTCAWLLVSDGSPQGMLF